MRVEGPHKPLTFDLDKLVDCNIRKSYYSSDTQHLHTRHSEIQQLHTSQNWTLNTYNQDTNKNKKKFLQYFTKKSTYNTWKKPISSLFREERDDVRDDIWLIRGEDTVQWSQPFLPPWSSSATSVLMPASLDWSNRKSIDMLGHHGELDWVFYFSWD